MVLISNINSIALKRTETKVTATKCPIGSISSNGYWEPNECTKCPDGSSTAELLGATECTECDLGKFSRDGYSCGCPNSGQYADTVGTSWPKYCVAGKYSTYSIGGSIGECTDCPAGYYGDATGASACSSCAAGKYSDAAGASACTSCAVGYYMTNTGRSACRLSQAGYKTTDYSSDATGATGTTGCGVNKYSSEGATICLTCDAGKSTNSLSGQSACV